MCSPEVRDWVTSRLTWDMCNCVTVACSLRSISSESQLFVLVSRDECGHSFILSWLLAMHLPTLGLTGHRRRNYVTTGMAKST